MAQQRVNPLKFMREVRTEATKVTWPSFKDTRMMTLMVCFLVAIVALYLLLVDFFVGMGINTILGV